jgi:alkane 1-monooxygenase
MLQGLLPFLFLASVPAARLIGPHGPWLVLPEVLLAFMLGDAWLAPEQGRRHADRSWRYRLPLWLYAAAQLGVIAWGVGIASQIDGAGALAGLIVATGLTAGIFGMLVAHELFHSRAASERALGVALLCGMTYPHFRLSHLYVHHRIGGTLADPATARLGEGAYRFILRSVAGQVRQAWRLERRLARSAGRPLRGNRLYFYLIAVLALYGAAALGCGWRGVGFLFGQSLVAIFILELFNYIAHYGLLRQIGADGRPEPMAARHSWNATQSFSNLALFNGGRHTAHHQLPAASYQTLTVSSDVPMLPSGFAGSICLALVPPLWRRVMDPRVAYWSQRSAG